MTSSDPRALLPLLLLLAACGGGAGTAAGPAAPPPPVGAAPNVLPVSVAGPGCSPGAYLNGPCVSVTVCLPGTTTCQTVGDVLLDTGSSGLRLFSQVLTLPLPSVSAAGQPVAECIGYADGTSHWGPVVRASVTLGGEPAVQVPIQLVDATFGTRPAACSNAEASPATAGFNGILGVGVYQEDCGAACTASGNGLYFRCGTGCTGTALALGSQVRNPVAALPVDSNGVLVHLPAVAAPGAASVEGQLILGIGTRGNNQPPAATRAYPLDTAGEFRTTLGGVTVTAFADTGSNGLFFPPPAGAGLSACPAPASAWYCPASTVTLTAGVAGWSGAPSAPLTFQVGDFGALRGSIGVAPQVGGPQPAGGSFDWGLPFHLGRDVYVGMERRSSSLGAGPLVAF